MPIRPGQTQLALVPPYEKWALEILTRADYDDYWKHPSVDFRRHWDKNAQVPWLYNPTSRVWITYDDARSIAAKAKFARRNKLGGIMIWELSGDDGTLLPAINRELR